MTNNNKIVMLPRELLHPHPDNPRKDLGDLTELKESIKAHGVMQNLTVVPDDDDGDGYKILIGHRRFAASEGILEELPCVVAKGLTDRDQVGIMLVENIQRSDLTFVEQAHGFQMMMDLGYNMAEVEEKTGFSETTIRRRLSLLDLDRELVEGLDNQITLKDLETVAKIKSPKIREQLLGEYGGNKTLQVRAATAITEERRAEAEKELKGILTKEYGIKKDGGAVSWKIGFEKLCAFNLLADEWDFTDIEEALKEIEE